MSLKKWKILFPDEVLCEYTGILPGDYFSRAQPMYRAQTEGAKKINTLYGVNLASAEPRVACPAYLQAAAFGSELVIPRDHPPMLKETGAPAAEDVFKLKMPDSYLETPEIVRYRKIKDEMEKLHGAPVSMSAGLEGPVTTAKLIRGQDFFLDLYEAPDAAEHLLNLSGDSFIRFKQEIAEYNGEVTGEFTGIADDFAGLLSPAMYGKYAQPQYRKIYDKLGKKHRTLHSELLRRDHLAFLPELNLDSFDPGQDQYLELTDLTELLVPRGIPFWFNVKTSTARDSNPEEIERFIRAAVSGGAENIMIELTPGIPRDNVRAMIKTFQELEEKS
ncbi:MAG: uroporphyrinogen decarboxylase family protein [Spirochaetia bacterium]